MYSHKGIFLVKGSKVFLKKLHSMTALHNCVLKVETGWALKLNSIYFNLKCEFP